MYQTVNLYNEPREILISTQEKYCEMTADEQGFLCGLIKEKEPKKILEVGVAGGGTTSVIMKCLDIVNPDAHMYSCDLNEECYRKKGKRTGYQLEEVKECLSNYSNHKFCLGGVLPQFIDEIGPGIDFCILDTAHSMPGEILDFLCALPYLKDGAIVVLHDVANNLLGKYPRAYATKVLLDSVYAEKYYNYDSGINNIAAFMVRKETREYIANVFSALSITWTYEPSIAEIMLYRDSYKNHYDSECIKLFDVFWELNHKKISELMSLNSKQ